MAQACNWETFSACLDDYYHSLGDDSFKKNDKRGKFIAFCEDNGFEKTDFESEIKDGIKDPENCAFVDFDEAFPLQSGIDDDYEKNIEIMRIFQYIFENNKAPPQSNTNEQNTVSLIEFSEHYKQLKRNDLEKTKNIYKSQVSFLNKAALEDNTLMTFLSIGATKTNTPFLLHMVDSFNRDRIDAYLRNADTGMAYDIKNWLNELKNVSAKHKIFFDKLGSAIQSYCARISPKLQFSPVTTIQDSLSDISLYIAMLSVFVDYQIKQRLPPFHMDFVIAVKGIHNSLSMGAMSMETTEDDSEDDSDDNTDDYVDDAKDETEIGDMKAKLKKAKCVFFDGKITETDFEYLKHTTLDDDESKVPENVMIRSSEKMIMPVFDKLVNALKKQEKKYSDYPHKRRLVGFIDRRQSKKEFNDSMIFFNPKDGCNEFPKSNVVPEMYFSASRQCILPVEHAFGGGLLTVSFHVDDAETVRCYLFLSGQCIRFYPQDIIDILPNLFDPKFQDNAGFAKSQDAIKIANEMKIKDVKFEQFYRMLHKENKNKKEFPRKL